jgi:O-succinylbenzoic acid--CoA ligase
MIPKIHPLFRLNNIPLDHEGLMAVAYSYVKEGEPWEKEVGDFVLNWLDDFEVVTVYSSGSTGKPKPIKLKKQHMINSALQSEERFNVHEESEALSCLPYSYIAGKMMMVRALTCGWNLDLVEPSASPLAKLRKRYDFTALTAYQLSNSLDDLHKSRKIIVGGGAIASGLIAQLDGKHSKIYHTYGMTETCSHIAVRKIHPEYMDSFETLPDVQISTDDRDCLVIKAGHLCDNEFVTNDIVNIIDENHFIVKGRIDNIINTGGVKVHPETIEDVLSKQIKDRFFVAGIEDEKLGQQITLFIETNDQKYHIENLQMDKLDKYHRPKTIHYLESFPETHTGKIDKQTILRNLEMPV